MIRCPLSTLLTAALGTAALSTVLAQGAATKPKSNPPASNGPAARSTATTSTNTTPKTTTSTSSKSDSSVVGSVNGQPVTWGQVIAKMRSDPQQSKILDDSLAQAVAGDAIKTFFGPHPSDTFTITRAQAYAYLRDHPTQAVAQQLDLMLTMMAIDQEATREHVQPTEKEVNDKVSEVMANLHKQHAIPDGQTDEQFLQAHNMTLTKLRINYRPQVQVLNLIRQETTAKLGHPMGAADLVQASHILIAVNVPATATPEEKTKADAEALDKIKKILADIRADKISFADAAKANSEDGTKDKGGDLGIFTHGMMVKEFENQAFNAKPGVVSDPVRTQFGYHLILVTKKGNDIPPADRETFIENYTAGQVRNYVETLMKKDSVVNKLTALLPAPSSMGPLGGGGVRPRGASPQ